MYPAAATAEYQLKQSDECMTATQAGLRRLALSVVLLLGAVAVPAAAQDSAPADLMEPAAENATPEDALLLDDVVVTAQKREQSIQDVPVSITAFDAEQLDAAKVRDLGDLTVGVPNVGFDEIGTSRGTANFSIRGLGINSSIPTIDPTVGVFVDGVYMGTNAMVLYDAFDLEGIEVLRGPQGVLFGRNVVGGAVLLNTRTPTDQYEARLRTSVEGGGKAPNVYVSGTLNAPLTDTLAARFTVYSNQDQGWFENEYDDRAFGAQDTIMLRPVLSWQPLDTLSLTLRYEYQDLDGDGAAVQDTSRFDRRSHDFSVNNDGFLDTKIHFLNARLDWDVPLGNGTVTNIFAWRDAQADALSSVDELATTTALRNFETLLRAEQFSNEVRYAGVFFNRLQLTTGFYYFTNALDYHERRKLTDDPQGKARVQNGGGLYDVETFGVFMAGDYDLTDWLTLNTGLRFSYEEKEADVTTIVLDLTTCNIVHGPACPSDFKDKESWHTLSPKVGLTYWLAEHTQVYVHWTRGFRSGAYNLRNTHPDVGPGPTDEEQIDNYELGFKSTIRRRAHLSGAIFFSQVEDMQREVLFDLPDGGFAQVVRNTADTDIFGLELEGSLVLTQDLVLLASMGYIDTEYTEVRFDLTGDSIVDGKDEDLEPPRAPTWTYSLGLLHTLEVGSRYRLDSRINYSYRDKEYNTDDNDGFNRQLKMLEVGVDIHLNDSQWVVGLYGKNLLNQVRHGINAVGGAFSPLAKGRVYGLELTYRYTGI